VRFFNEEQRNSMSDLAFNLCALTYLGVVLEYALGESGDFRLVAIGLCAMLGFVVFGLVLKGDKKWKQS